MINCMRILDVMRRLTRSTMRRKNGEAEIADVEIIDVETADVDGAAQ